MQAGRGGAVRGRRSERPNGVSRLDLCAFGRAVLEWFVRRAGTIRVTNRHHATAGDHT